MAEAETVGQERQACFVQKRESRSYQFLVAFTGQIFEHMQAAGYTDFERGERGSTAEHLSVLDHEIQQDTQHISSLNEVIETKENTANVRRIFRLSVEGYGPAQITRLLNDEHILNPSGYKYEHGILKKARPCKDQYFWNTRYIRYWTRRNIWD